MRFPARLLTAGFLNLLTALTLTAQTQGVTVSGIITTIDGARLPHATVTLTDQKSGQIFRGTSDDLGAFALDGIPPGVYTFVTEFPGLATKAVDNVVVAADLVTRIDCALEPMDVRETVTVSAGVPRESVEATQVRESSARDVGELLSESPGLWKVRKGAIANDVVLRGLQSRDLNVLIDGERLYGACPNHMDPPAFHVDFSQVERVDVGKGPFDVRYQGSLGGIVNVVTRRPEVGWKATATLSAGSYGFINPSATGSYGSEHVAMLGGYSYRRSDPYTDGHGNLMTQGANYRSDALDSDAFRATTGWARGAWKPAPGHQIEASYTRQQSDHVLYPYLQMDAIWDDADRASVEYDSAGLGSRVSGLKAQAYWSRVDHWMTDEYRTSSTTAPRGYSMGTDATTFTAGGRVEARLGSATIGGEAFRRNWNTETLMAAMASYAPQYSIPDVNIDSAGVFVEQAWTMGSRASLDLGGRIDRVSTAADSAKANTALYQAYHATVATSMNDLLPAGRAKLTVKLSPDLVLATTVGHTARVAEANERFFALRRMGSDWVGNPDLAPARNTGVDVFLSLSRARVTLTGNAYVNDIHDYIAVYAARRQSMVPGVMNVTARSYANVDARLRGVEAGGSWTVRTPLSISGDVSYVRGTMTPRADLAMTSTDLAEMPPLRARLRARLDNGRLFGELEGIASAEQTHVDTSLGETTTPSYAIANLTGGIHRGPLSVIVGVANLFDRYYVEHLSYQRDPFRSGVRVADPGRNFFTNVLWKF